VKNRRNRRRRLLKKGLEEGFERVEKFFGKKLYPEQRLVLAYLYQNKDVTLRARTGFGKSMLFFGFVLMMPANTSRFITIILTPLQALGHRHSAELNELCNRRYQEEKAKQDRRAAEKKAQRDARGAATSFGTIVSTIDDPFTEPATAASSKSDSSLRASQRDNDGGKKKAKPRKPRGKKHNEYGPPPKGSCYLDGTSSTQDIRNIGNGKYRWVFVGPEKAKHPVFQQLLKDESFRSHVNLVAIDEGHLIDEWFV
jgi:superfamily II DNA helicase RecQ